MVSVSIESWPIQIISGFSYISQDMEVWTWVQWAGIEFSRNLDRDPLPTIHSFELVRECRQLRTSGGPSAKIGMLSMHCERVAEETDDDPILHGYRHCQWRAVLRSYTYHFLQQSTGRLDQVDSNDNGSWNKTQGIYACKKMADRAHFLQRRLPAKSRR